MAWHAAARAILLVFMKPQAAKLAGKVLCRLGLKSFSMKKISNEKNCSNLSALALLSCLSSVIALHIKIISLFSRYLRHLLSAVRLCAVIIDSKHSVLNNQYFFQNKQQKAENGRQIIIIEKFINEQEAGTGGEAVSSSS